MKNGSEDVIRKTTDTPRKPYHPPEILSHQNLEAVAADCGKTSPVGDCAQLPPVIS